MKPIHYASFYDNTEIMVVDLFFLSNDSPKNHIPLRAKLLIREPFGGEAFVGRTFDFTIIKTKKGFSFQYDQEIQWLYHPISFYENIGKEVIYFLLTLPTYRLRLLFHPSALDIWKLLKNKNFDKIPVI